MEDGQILFFNWEDENEEATLCEIYSSRIKSMKYVDGFLATCSSSGELNLWKITVEDKVEMEMVCGIDVGCRLICLDIVELKKAGIHSEIKDEVEEEEKKTVVRQLQTSGTVTIEIEEETEKAENPIMTSASKNGAKKRRSKPPVTPVSNKKSKKRQSVRLSNGFVEEDC